MRFLIVLLCAIFSLSAGYKVNHKVLTVITDDSVFENADEDRNSRLINSNNATDGQFPFSARFSLSRIDGRVTRCSGSIISSNFVLSAGKIFTEYP